MISGASAVVYLRGQQSQSLASPTVKISCIITAWKGRQLLDSSQTGAATDPSRRRVLGRDAMRLDKQFIICGSRRYGHAAGIFGAGLGAVLATSWAALHPCAQALACWLVVEAAFYLQQLWR